MSKYKTIATKIVNAFYDNGSISRHGCYGLPNDVAVDVVESILENKKSYLNEYDNLVYLRWSLESLGEDISDENIVLWNCALKGENYWNINAMFSEDEISQITNKVIISENKIKLKKTYSDRRKVASSYIQKEEVRKKIFKKCKHKCVRCDSVSDLTIDHIISVKNNGDNTLDNLQILCRSCNSKKGSR